MILRIYRQEESEGVWGCTILEPVAGAKRYLRVWDSGPDMPEWGWSLSESALLVWVNADPLVAHLVGQ